MVTSQKKHHQTIDHLLEKFTLSKEEFEILGNLKKLKIHSICYATEGGFDKKSGEFYPEEQSNLSKIRIKYEDECTKEIKLIYLV